MAETSQTVVCGKTPRNAVKLRVEGSASGRPGRSIVLQRFTGILHPVELLSSTTCESVVTCCVPTLLPVLPLTIGVSGGRGGQGASSVNDISAFTSVISAFSSEVFAFNTGKDSGIRRLTEYNRPSYCATIRCEYRKKFRA